MAGELELRWNSALERVREIEGRIDSEQARRDEARPPAPDVIRELAADLPRVWNHPDADARLKKRIARAVIEEIVVDVNAPAGEVVLVVHWKGGVHTELRVRRRRRGESRHAAPAETVDAVRALTLVSPDTMIAGYLNRNGLRTGKGNRWTRERVTSLRGKRGVPRHSPERKRAEGLMTLTEAAVYTGIGQRALRCAAERGDIEALHPLAEGPWIFRRQNLGAGRGREVIERARLRMKGGGVHCPGQLGLLESGT